MKDLEFNKIFAALLVAGITASLSGFIALKLTAVEPLKQNAYKIEGVVSSAGGAAPVEEKAQPILDMIATADAAKGEQISKVCAACHVFTKGGPNGMGPNLYGVVGRAKGSHPGFDYSDGMKKKGGNWTFEDLNKFLYKPKAFVDGTKMTFIGLKKPEDRAAVIAYLRTLSDSPAAAPSAAEIAAEKAELAPPDDKAKPADKGDQTAPNAKETGTPGGKVSGKAAKTGVKPLSAKDATAAVPEGNGGTGVQESNPDVKQGAKPADNGADKTPQEKLQKKLGQ